MSSGIEIESPVRYRIASQNTLLWGILTVLVFGLVGFLLIGGSIADTTQLGAHTSTSSSLEPATASIPNESGVYPRNGLLKDSDSDAILLVIEMDSSQRNAYVSDSVERPPIPVSRLRTRTSYPLNLSELPGYIDSDGAGKELNWWWWRQELRPRTESIGDNQEHRNETDDEQEEEEDERPTWYEAEETRIFDATRENPEAEEHSRHFQQTRNAFGVDHERLEELAMRHDFVYQTTEPVWGVDNGSDIRMVDLEGIFDFEWRGFEGEPGRWTSKVAIDDSPPPEVPGRYIKDARLTTIGIPTEVSIPANDVYSEDVALIPQKGTFYQYADYRVNATQGDCDRIDEETRFCWNASVTSKAIKNQTLEFSTERISILFGGYDNYTVTIDYELPDFDPAEELLATSRAEANITVEYTNRTYTRDNDTWELDSVSNQRSFRTKNLTTYNEYIHLPPDAIGAHQTVFEEPEGLPKVVLEIGLYNASANATDPPQTNRERLLTTLWSHLYFGDPSEARLVDNVWGVYSKADRQTQFVRFKDQVIILDGPAFPRLKLLAHEPQPREVKVETLTEHIDDVIVASEAPLLEENVTLDTPEFSRTYTTVLYHEPSGREIHSIEDIHGNEMPLNTTHVEVKETTLAGEVVDRDTGRIRFTLTDQNGAPLSNETLTFTGAMIGTATTNEAGVVLVEANDRTVEANYNGYEPVGFDTDQDVAYREAATSVTVDRTGWRVGWIRGWIDRYFASVAMLIIVLLSLWFAARNIR